MAAPHGVPHAATTDVHPVIAGLRRARVEKNLCQADLALDLDMNSTRTLTRWENGHNGPLFAAVVEWADALGFDVVLAPRGAS